MTGHEALSAIVDRLAAAAWRDRDAVKAELLAAATALQHEFAVLDELESLKRGVDSLEVRWEIDEVIEVLTPEPPPEPEEPQAEEEPEAEEAPPGQLTAADLDLVYDDPRGLILHKSKVGERWFATQRDPNTGQPQTFELHQQEIGQLMAQLKGSPYWVIGGGGGGA